MRTRPFAPTALLLSLLFPASVTAAEIRGNFSVDSSSSIQKAPKIVVTCGSFSQQATLDSGGSYSIRGLPSSSSCSYKIELGAEQSAAIGFNSGTGVVRIDGILRSYGGKIIVISK